MCGVPMDATFHGGSNDTIHGRVRHRWPEISPIFPYPWQLPTSMASLLLSTAINLRWCRCHRRRSLKIRGTLIPEKNLKSKISCQTPFKYRSKTNSFSLQLVKIEAKINKKIFNFSYCSAGSPLNI